MTRSAQVLHIALKDVRATRWYLAGYVLVVAWAFYRAIWPAGTSSFLWPIAVLLTASVLAAIVIQLDSPWRADAFWPTQPLDRWAMVLAKLLVLVAVIGGIALAGQAGALLAHRPEPGRFVPLMAQAGVAMTIAVCYAAVIGAITRDLKSFLLVSIVLIAIENMIAVLVAMQGLDGPRTVLLPQPLWSGILLVSLPGLLAWTYRSRTRRVAIGVGTLLFALGAAMAGQSEAPAIDSTPLSVDDVRGVSPALLAYASPPAGGRPPVLMVELPDPPDNFAYTLSAIRVEFDTGHGTPVTVRVKPDPVWLNSPGIPLDANVTWWGGSRGRVGRMGLGLDLSGDEQKRIANGFTRVTVHGRVTVHEPTIGAVLPLRPGSRITATNLRIRVDDVEESDGETRVDLAVSNIESRSRAVSREPGSPFNLIPRHVLYDRDRNEAIRLYWDGASNTGAGLVVPGTSSQRGLIRLSSRLHLSVGDTASSGAPWAGRSDLLMIDWQPVASYEVRVVAEPGPG